MNSSMKICEGCCKTIQQLDETSKMLFKKFVDKHLFNNDEYYRDKLSNIERYRIGSYNLLTYKDENAIVLLELVPGFKSNSVKN